MNTTTATAGRLITTPHPITLEGQVNQVADLYPGESLYAFLGRSVEGFHDQRWEVTIGGVVVPKEHWERIKPKHGQVIEARTACGKQALYIVAMVALMYFTMGMGGMAAAGGGSFMGLTGAAGWAAAAGTYMAGPALGGKVLV